MKYSRKGHEDRNRHQSKLKKKKSGQARLVYVKNINRSTPPREGEPVGTWKSQSNSLCTRKHSLSPLPGYTSGDAALRPAELSVEPVTDFQLQQPVDGYTQARKLNNSKQQGL